MQEQISKSVLFKNNERNLPQYVTGFNIAQNHTCYKANDEIIARNDTAPQLWNEDVEDSPLS